MTQTMSESRSANNLGTRTKLDRLRAHPLIQNIEESGTKGAETHIKVTYQLTDEAGTLFENRDYFKYDFASGTFSVEKVGFPKSPASKYNKDEAISLEDLTKTIENTIPNWTREKETRVPKRKYRIDGIGPGRLSIRLTAASVRVVQASPTFWKGEAVTVIKKGGKNTRIKRADGSITVVPNNTLDEQPQNTPKCSEVIEKAARDIEVAASHFRTQFAAVMLKEGHYTFVRDRRGMPIGPGRYEEVKTQEQAKELFTRLKSGGQFKDIRIGRI